jgi:hypothetical protein
MKQYTEQWENGKLWTIVIGQTSFPPDERNMDYVDYLRWKKEGGIPTILDITIVPVVAETRKAEYVKQGITTDALIVALWEKVVEGRPGAAEAIQAVRESVKLTIPKEEAE